MIRSLVEKALGLSDRGFELFAEGLKRYFSLEVGVRELAEERSVLLFPEGEDGNFKPSSKRYHLQRFHTGFLRMARETGAPIVPCLVIGAEEAHYNLGKVEFSTWGKTLKLLLPLNLIPWPTHWRICFLPPVDPSVAVPSDHELSRPEWAALAERFRISLQTAIDVERARNGVD